MTNPYVVEQIPADLQPRCDMSVSELRLEWQHMTEEERHEVYTPWLRAAKSQLGLEANANDASLIAANFAMKKVQRTRTESGWRLLKRAIEIFGVTDIEFFQEPKAPAQPVQRGLFG